MIAVDTSALIEIVLAEARALACVTALASEADGVISAATVTEALIVATRRERRDEMLRLLSKLDFEVVPLTEASARLAADAYASWGKGVHPAKLNFGDCFAYALAKERGVPLLYVGDDFAKTDIASVLQA